MLKRIMGLLILSISLNAIALEPVAKEETTPPPADGALTADKIPPILPKAAPPRPMTAPAMPNEQQPMPQSSEPPVNPNGNVINTQPVTGSP